MVVRGGTRSIAGANLFRAPAWCEEDRVGSAGRDEAGGREREGPLKKEDDAEDWGGFRKSDWAEGVGLEGGSA